MADISYWESIERYFAEKRGSALILSPKDWPLVNSWQTRNIPLDIIYEGIDKAFARFQATRESVQQHQRIRTLAYCQYDIEELWKASQENEAYRSAPSTEASEHTFLLQRQQFSTKLRSLIGRLRKYAENPHYHCIIQTLHASSDTLESFLPLLEHVETQAAFTEILEKCHAVEQKLHEQLEQSLDDTTRQELRAKAEAKLASHKQKMTRPAYQKTLQIAFLQELREAYPLPLFL